MEPANDPPSTCVSQSQLAAAHGPLQNALAADLEAYTPHLTKVADRLLGSKTAFTTAWEAAREPLIRALESSIVSADIAHPTSGADSIRIVPSCAPSFEGSDDLILHFDIHLNTAPDRKDAWRTWRHAGHFSTVLYTAPTITLNTAPTVLVRIKLSGSEVGSCSIPVAPSPCGTLTYVPHVMTDSVPAGDGDGDGGGNCHVHAHSETAQIISGMSDKLLSKLLRHHYPRPKSKKRKYTRAHVAAARLRRAEPLVRRILPEGDTQFNTGTYVAPPVFGAWVGRPVDQSHSNSTSNSAICSTGAYFGIQSRSQERVNRWWLDFKERGPADGSWEYKVELQPLEE